MKAQRHPRIESRDPTAPSGLDRDSHPRRPLTPPLSPFQPPKASFSPLPSPYPLSAPTRPKKNRSQKDWKDKSAHPSSPRSLSSSPRRLTSCTTPSLVSITGTSPILPSAINAASSWKGIGAGGCSFPVKTELRSFVDLVSEEEEEVGGLRYRLYMEMLIGEYLLWEDVRSGRAKWDLGEGEGRTRRGRDGRKGGGRR